MDSFSESGDLVSDPKARVRAVLQHGSYVDFNETVPLKRYLRSASEIYRMASVYKDEGNIESALKLYTRYITLLVENAPKHPEYKAINKEEKQRSQRHLPDAFKIAEELKQKLELEFELQAARYLEELEQTKAAAEDARRLQEAWSAADVPSGYSYSNDIGRKPTSGEIHPVIVNTHDIAYPEFGSATPSAPTLPEAEKSMGLPAYDRATKPKTLAATGVSYLPSNSFGLRDVLVPRNLIGKFMILAEKNTKNNIETCGVLCGKLANNRFIVTHLVVPTQSGTADSCTTDHEEEVFDFQDKYDLITLGWIHTHPSQSAFLSSVDLHTHCSYQLMLPEAIAVVCSPRHNETGVFMLTPDHGLKQISACREKGFHPHEQNPPLFVSCPHASLSDAYNASVVDLRKAT